MNIYRKKYYADKDKKFAKKSEIPQEFRSKNPRAKKLQKAPQVKKIFNTTKATTVPPNIFHRVLTKMGFGNTPSLVAYIQTLNGATDKDKLLTYIDEQLEPQLIDDTDVDLLLSQGYQTLNKTRMQLYQEHYTRPDGAEIEWEYHILPGTETYYATFVKAIRSNRQLYEMMADFWHNHFNVYLDGDGIPPMFVHYDRDVIRPNALGNFRDMLEQVTKATCMLDYLGNAYNNFEAPNENFARELLELHTLGAKNYYGHTDPTQVGQDAQNRKVGYVENDVVEMARALTGWSYSGADWDEIVNGTATGEFYYRDDWHDKNSKTIMGQTFDYDANNPLKDMQNILDLLAEHPATAEFLASKLCKRFISDNPSQAIIDQVKDTLHQNWQSPNQIKLAMETLLKSDDFFNTWGEKIKRPFERAVSAMRQMNYSFDFNPNDEKSSWHFWGFNNSGQNPFYWTSPNGYPDVKSAWLGASSIMSTWRYIQWITTNLKDGNLETSLNYHGILAETLTHLPNAQDRTANNLVNYWFERICGVTPSTDTQANLAQFMSYSTYSEVSEWTPTDKNLPIDLSSPESNVWPSYNKERLNAMVAAIFLSSEFLNR